MANNVVSEWQDKITLALKARKKFSSESDWPLYRSLYRGDFDQKIFLNEIFGIGKTIVPRVYFKTPHVAVTPKRPEYAGHARVIEAVDNWLIRELFLKQTLKKAALDAYICGVGFVKLGFDSEFGYIPETSTLSDSGTVTQHSVKDARRIEYQSFIKPGMPWALRIRPEDVVVPFGYDDPWCLPWIAFMHLRQLSDVKEDHKYNNNRSKLKGGYLPRVAREGLRIRRDSELFRSLDPWVLLFEIHDYAYGKVYVIAEDELLLDEKDELQVEGLPVEVLRFHEDTEYFWGISDVKQLMPQQEELNDVKKFAAKLRRYNIIKFLYLQGSLTKDALDNLLSSDFDDIGAGIEVAGEILSSSVMPLQPHNLTGDLEKDKQMILSDVRETMGTSRNTQGEFIPMTSKTATEAKFVDAGVSVRMDERRDAMADCLSNILRKWNQYIFKFWTQERVIEIAGEDGLRYWVEYTGEQLEGEYFINIDPEAGQPISRELKYQFAKELFMELRNDPLINQVALRRQLLRQYDWLDPEASLLLQEPQPQMEIPGEEVGPPGPEGQVPMPTGPGMPRGQAMPFKQFLTGGK